MLIKVVSLSIMNYIKNHIRGVIVAWIELFRNLHIEFVKN